MNGDFTRNTFVPSKHYSAVRQQQGRVQLDADFNEWVDICQHLGRSTTADIVGLTGMPAGAAGFEISTLGGDLLVGCGRAYVDGILVEHEQQQVVLHKINDTGSAAVWQQQSGVPLLVGQWLQPASSRLEEAFQVTEVEQQQGARRVKLSREFSGDNLELLCLTRLIDQPYLERVHQPDSSGNYLIYLDVWERDLTCLEDPGIQEVALAGVDTCIRTQLLWQVKTLALEDANPVCKDFAPPWAPSGSAVPLSMAARANPAAEVPSPCVMPSDSGYRSLENHLYRVEVHASDGSGQDEVLIKWSRDNAIHNAKLVEVTGDRIRLSSGGRDTVSGFKADDWLEITDQARRLNGQPGFFARISSAQDNSFQILELLHPDSLQPLENNGVVDLSLLPQSGWVCRWEGGKPTAVPLDEWHALELGIEVLFKAGRASQGDFWQIPARTLNGQIEWPIDPINNGPLTQLPMGIKHHYCALAIGRLDQQQSWSLSDCRNLFPALNQSEELFYVAGDGQMVTPTKPLDNSDATIELASALIVGVSRGQLPAKGRQVRFSVTAGLGHLENNQRSIVVTTSAQGLASVRWWLDRSSDNQQLRAELIDSGGEVKHLPIMFSAKLNKAADIAFTAPPSCATFAGAATVEEALVKLCGIEAGAGCATYVVTPEDWLSVIEGLRAGENAHICFKRGNYQSSAPLVLKGLGHISLSGIGDGSFIEVHNSETALNIQACQSVKLSSLRIHATETADRHISGINGVVDISRTPAVSIHSLNLRCGSSLLGERCCIRLRGDQQTQSVDIYNNQLNVGHLQKGVVVTNSRRVRIRNNQIQVVKRNATAVFEKMLQDKKLRSQLLERLVSSPDIGNKPGQLDKRKSLHMAGMVGFIHSSVPQTELDALLRKNPPTANTVDTKNRYRDYLTKLFDKVLERPASLPSYARQIKRLGAVGNQLDRGVRKELIYRGKIEVMKIAEARGAKGKVELVVGGNWVLFDSPFGASDWKKLLKKAGVEKVNSNLDLLQAVVAVAERLIDDRTFRQKLKKVAKWFDSLKQDNPSVGDQAIVCAGQHITDLVVDDNSVKGFMEGIHIGVSAGDSREAPALSIASVVVTSNRIQLLASNFRGRGYQGIFIGNAQRILVESNQLLNNIAKTDRQFDDGILIWGHLGSFILLRQNQTQNCASGLHVEQLSEVKGKLWRAIDNLIESAGSRPIRLPSGFIQRDNVSF